MTEQTHATRTCSACGKRKPLMAFLELSGSDIHTHGDICAECRGAGLGQKSGGEIDSDKSGGTTRAQLDNKMRMRTEQDRRQQFKEHTEKDQKEKAKKENLESKEHSSEEETEETEKKHREEYLEQQTTSSSNTDIPLKTADIGQRLSQGFYQEKARTEKSQTQYSVNKQEAVQKDGVNTQQSNKEEAKKTSTDLSVTFIDDNTATIRRSAGSVFGQFRQLLGQSAAINRSMKQYAQKNAEATKAKTGPASSTFLKETPKEKPAEKEQKVTEFISGNFKKR